MDKSFFHLWTLARCLLVSNRTWNSLRVESTSWKLRIARARRDFFLHNCGKWRKVGARVLAFVGRRFAQSILLSRKLIYYIICSAFIQATNARFDLITTVEFDAPRFCGVFVETELVRTKCDGNNFGRWPRVDDTLTHRTIESIFFFFSYTQQSSL